MGGTFYNDSDKDDVMDEVEWQGVEARSSKSGGMYMQPDLADSNATIRPLLDRPAARNSEDDISSGSDSEWSVVEKCETEPMSTF
jgi:hypothetical protein